MSLHKLARELEETARQSSAMVDGIAEALAMLSDESMTCENSRRRAAAMIVNAIQGQDRIEQRCRNMALAVRRFAVLPGSAEESDYDEIWSSLTLDELRVPGLSGIAAAPSSGDVDLF
jgi:hypothetical protein